jgi:hypothetical protein
MKNLFALYLNLLILTCVQKAEHSNIPNRNFKVRQPVVLLIVKKLN